MAMMDWIGWEPRERAALVFLVDHENVLLIHKKRGLGAGKVNAPGGRLEPGEVWEQAALRETREETGLTPARVAPAANLWFQFVEGYSLETWVFVGHGYSGQLTACDEADPFWVPKTDLPWTSMWADDPLWLPPVLEGRGVLGRFVFDGDTMIEAKLEIRDRPEQPKGRLTTEAVGL